MPANLEAENRRLRDQIEELQERERQRVERVRVVEALLPAEWRLSGAQRIALLTMLESPNYSVSRHQFLDALRRNNLKTRDVDNLICRMRPGIRKFGITILTIWGVGYRLTNESADIIKSAIEKIAGSEIQRLKLATAMFVREPT
jgi:DNA-binding response OmpR family regulator